MCRATKSLKSLRASVFIKSLSTYAIETRNLIRLICSSAICYEIPTLTEIPGRVLLRRL